MRWWRDLKGQPETDTAPHPAGGTARILPPSHDGALVPVGELDAAVHALREVLTADRARIRPDAWASAWRSAEAAGELREGWTAMTQARGEDTLALLDLLQQRILPALQDFLAMPDSFKPANADDLHAAVSAWETEVRRRARRLARVYSVRLQARVEMQDDL